MTRLTLGFLMLAACLRAQTLAPLRSNGALFTAGENRLVLRCFDAPQLLFLEAKAQDELLDRAAAAGFNSLSFEAPLYGENGMCGKLGTMDPARPAALRDLLMRMEARRLYAFPVLWNKAAVEAFSKLGGGEEKFFSGKVQIQWQAWILRQLVSSQGLSATASLGGWILHRGPWPGPKARPAEPQGTADPQSHSQGQAFTASQRLWLAAQVRTLRAARSSQLCGLGYWFKGDLGAGGSGQDLGLGSLQEPPPLAALLEQETQPADPMALDKLPPVPGAEGMLGEAATGITQALTPWDLEGVDWDLVGRAVEEVPAFGGIDFMEMTLDTEDWYRVGEALADAVLKQASVPVYWRQDWRTASRYERLKRLEAPEGLAGLSGPWPESDWPASGETIWPLENDDDKGSPLSKALAFKYMDIIKEGGKPLLMLHLNRPSEVELEWGRAWPAWKKASSHDPSLVHRLRLKGAKFGEKVLISARAKSGKWGRAALKARWVYLREPGKAKAPVPKPAGR